MDKMSNDYEFTVESQDTIEDGNGNVQRYLVTVSTTVENERFEKQFRIAPRQLAQGTWEKHVVRWIDELQGNTHNVPDLEGETLTNSGIDHTGPDRDYPER